MIFKVFLIKLTELMSFKKWITPENHSFVDWRPNYKKGFPARFLTTAPGCNALAALRPLSSFPRNEAQLPQWLYADFRKKLWLPETTRHRLSAIPGSQRRNPNTQN
jgi:hypothetical protein